MNKSKNKIYISTPKTEADVRKIPMVKEVRQALKEIYDLYCKEEIKKYLEQNICYENHICRQIYEDWELTVRDYREIHNDCINYGIPMDCMIGKEQLDKADEITGQFIDILKENKFILPDEYYNNRDKYQYKDVLTLDYNNQQDNVKYISEEEENGKLLYILSSGQLSAVAIAIALTLNKIYAQDRMRCMFIDDSIQTMDELNIASFCEVLRTDFKEYQFILSIHEEDISDYIRYKYEKYGLGNQSVEGWNL